MALPEGEEASRAFQERLRGWFEDVQRDLPWRQAPHRGDAYAVLVSEVMLQQTRVDTVVPYFEAWMERWPTVEDLAKADEDSVLEAWQGLGFYHRARRLHAAAQAIVDDHDGVVPSSAASLDALPGVGPYTSAAVRAFAFGEPVPAVDGNTARVWARLEGAKQDIAKPSTKRAAGQALGPLVDAEDAGSLVEAFIELGAMVCTPSDPSCTACPVTPWCTAHQEDRVHEIPIATAANEVQNVDVVALLVQDAGHRVLLARRPREGLLGGLWGLPMTEAENGEGLEAAAGRCVPAARVRIMETGLGEVEHAFSHKRWRVKVHRARLVEGDPAEGPYAETWSWRGWDDRAGLPSSTLDQKVFEAVQPSLARFV